MIGWIESRIAAAEIDLVALLRAEVAQLQSKNWELCRANAALRDKIRVMVEEYFKQCRFDSDSHLGLGDIRLTIGMQEEILEMIDKA